MSASATQFTILKAARLIDGNGGPVAEQAAILLEGDTIKQVGTKETVETPEGCFGSRSRLWRCDDSSGTGGLPCSFEWHRGWSRG